MPEIFLGLHIVSHFYNINPMDFRVDINKKLSYELTSVSSNFEHIVSAKSFKYKKGIFQIIELLKGILNIANKTKICNKAVEKIFVVINELNVFATQINIINELTP